VDYTVAGQRRSLAADQVIVSCGAIGSSAVLLQSGIACQGQVGRRFHVFGGVLTAAATTEDLQSYDGIGLTAACRPDAPFILESFFSTPGAYAVTLPGWGSTYRSRMARYASSSQAGVMIGTTPRGVIGLRRSGAVTIKLSLGRRELAALALGQELLARIFLAGGADEVWPGLIRDVAIRSDADIGQARRLLRDGSNLIFGSAHPQGGNTLSDDPRRGVVDSTFRIHGFRNLRVVDASVLPTNLRANCQATVMALGYVAADLLLQQVDRGVVA
jgi:choline dehydrogenase